MFREYAEPSDKMWLVLRFFSEPKSLKNKTMHSKINSRDLNVFVLTGQKQLLTAIVKAKFKKSKKSLQLRIPKVYKNT